MKWAAADLGPDVPGDVALVRVDFDFGLSLGDPDFDVLSDDERAAAARFLRPADGIRFAATRTVLRAQLGEALGRSPASLRFRASPTGRPELEDRPAAPALDFNVSHSGDHALVAWSALRRVGVDVEMRRDGWDWTPLARQVFGAEDAAAVAGAPGAAAREALFYDVWVAKEALLKADGRGIGAGLDAFSVLPRGGTAPRVRGGSALAVSLRGFGFGWRHDIPGHAACLAWGDVASPGAASPPARG